MFDTFRMIYLLILNVVSTYFVEGCRYRENIGYVHSIYYMLTSSDSFFPIIRKLERNIYDESMRYAKSIII